MRLFGGPWQAQDVGTMLRERGFGHSALSRLTAYQHLPLDLWGEEYIFRVPGQRGRRR